MTLGIFKKCFEGISYYSFKKLFYRQNKRHENNRSYLNVFLYSFKHHREKRKCNKTTRSQHCPFSHLLITHSYLCSVLFTRSLKQVMMKTKGIRQAENESPDTVKTTAPPGGGRAPPHACSSWERNRHLREPQRFALESRMSFSQLGAASSSFHPATKSDKNRSLLIFFFQTTH